MANPEDAWDIVRYATVSAAGSPLLCFESECRREPTLVLRECAKQFGNSSV
jgi:hypothetical protein